MDQKLASEAYLWESQEKITKKYIILETPGRDLAFVFMETCFTLV